MGEGLPSVRGQRGRWGGAQPSTRDRDLNHQEQPTAPKPLTLAESGSPS